MPQESNKKSAKYSKWYSTKGIKGIAGKFYRVYCAYAKKDIHVNERKGKCKRCGACCRLPVRCIFYYNKRCLIYKYRFEPCRVYPARKTDLENMDCGFYFE